MRDDDKILKIAYSQKSPTQLWYAYTHGIKENAGPKRICVRDKNEPNKKSKSWSTSTIGVITHGTILHLSDKHLNTENRNATKTRLYAYVLSHLHTIATTVPIQLHPKRDAWQKKKKAQEH